MIELRDVSRAYVVGSARVQALRNVSLTIADGEYVAVMGPSGSGKSTLLNVVGCLDRPTSGTYRLDGTDVMALDDAGVSRVRARHIGFVFQSFQLVSRLTAADNVALPMVFAGIPPAVRSERTRVALESVGLRSRMHHRPAELSGGERQRVAIARAIVMAPSILLADEPTGNLDRTAGREIITLLEAMNAEGLTLIMVTHDPELGQRARRVVRMVDGAVVADERASIASAPVESVHAMA